MTFKTTLICAFALTTLTAMAATGAHAQTTRAAVKAEAAGAAASSPSGEFSTANQDRGTKPRASTTTRAAVKAETQVARDKGEIATGQQNTPRQGNKPAPTMTSNKTRAEVRGEAASANKAGVSRGGQKPNAGNIAGAKP